MYAPKSWLAVYKGRIRSKDHKILATRTFLRVGNIWDDVGKVGNKPHLGADAALALELNSNRVTGLAE